jgi:hypothetical protein
MMPPGGTTGPDGKFRICGLRAGNYRLMAYFPQPAGAPLFGTVHVTITDRDVVNLQVLASPGLPVPGSVVWEGAAPEPPLAATLSVYLRNLDRIGFQGEGSSMARSSVPGEFSFPSVLLDEYEVFTNWSAPGVYVKDIVYGTASVLHEPLRVGSAIGTGGLRVVLARDGASMAVKVADKDGNPVPDIHVVILPAEVPSEAAVAERMVAGETDQDGAYVSGVLPPGKYYVLATRQKVDHSVDSIGRLWSYRARAKTVELGPGASAQVTLEPM